MAPTNKALNKVKEKKMGKKVKITIKCNVDDPKVRLVK